MKYLLTVLCGFMLFAGCNEDNEVTNDTESKENTVIVYVTGDNSLNEFVDENVNDAISATEHLDDSCRLVMIVDKRYAKPYILEVKKGVVEKRTDYDKDFTMTDPAEMKEVLTSVMNEHKSNNFGLLLWGHSTGWFIESDSVKTRGYGPDSESGTGQTSSKWINFPTLASVLESLPLKFEYIIGDCCLLQCAEVAYELRNSTHYLIGSPAETTSVGFPYKQIVPYLFDFSESSYFKIADIGNHYYYDTEEITLPLSVVKTSAMQDLASATKGVIEAGALPYPVSTSDAVYYFKWYDKKNVKTPIMYDIRSIMKRNVATNHYTQWEKALDAAVIYKKRCNKWITSYQWTDDFTVTDDNYGGMSMYFPMEKMDGMPYYDCNENIKKMQWYEAAGIDKYTK